MEKSLHFVEELFIENDICVIVAKKELLVIMQINFSGKVYGYIIFLAIVVYLLGIIFLRGLVLLTSITASSFLSLFVKKYFYLFSKWSISCVDKGGIHQRCIVQNNVGNWVGCLYTN